MNESDLMACRPGISYQCARCCRCFVAWGGVDPGEAVCICGEPLLERWLASGLYELLLPAQTSRFSTTSGRAMDGDAIAKESDLGYGASHGYGPAHGGPSGPGDAPATGRG
jgi:hypothetical protein